MASDDNAIGVELRGGRALAWRVDDGRRHRAWGCACRAARAPVELRLTHGRERPDRRSATQARAGGRSAASSRRRAGRAGRAWHCAWAAALARGRRSTGCGSTRARPAPTALRVQHRHAAHAPLAREAPDLRPGTRAGQVADRLELRCGDASEARRAAATSGRGPSTGVAPAAIAPRAIRRRSGRRPPSAPRRLRPGRTAAPETRAARRSSHDCPRWPGPASRAASGIVRVSSRSPPNASRIAFDSRSMRNRCESRPARRASVTSASGPSSLRPWHMKPSRRTRR